MSPTDNSAIMQMLSDPKVTNESIVALFRSLNQADNMASTNPKLCGLFARAFMDRKIDLRDYPEQRIREATMNRLTKHKIRQIIREEMEIIARDKIKDTVMDVLSDEGGAAGLEPIEDELEDLEDDEQELPDEEIEAIIGKVAGVKRHADGDFIDTTQLESRMITKQKIRRIIEANMVSRYQADQAEGPAVSRQEYALEALEEALMFCIEAGCQKRDVIALVHEMMR